MKNEFRIPDMARGAVIPHKIASSILEEEARSEKEKRERTLSIIGAICGIVGALTGIAGLVVSILK